MDIPYDLLIHALVAGLLLGAFYAAVTVGISISFGILDIVNIAHPGFIILGSYIAYIVNTRLGFDPWREAARLSGLPRETAARAFAVTISMLPEGDWKASDSEAIAARLVNWLPGRSTLAIPSLVTAPIGGERIKAGFATWLVWGVLAIALLFLGLHILGR